MSGDNYELVQCYKTTLPQRMMMLIYEFLVGVDYQKWHSFAFFLRWCWADSSSVLLLLPKSCWKSHAGQQTHTLKNWKLIYTLGILNCSFQYLIRKLCSWIFMSGIMPCFKERMWCFALFLSLGDFFFTSVILNTLKSKLLVEELRNVADQ